MPRCLPWTYTPAMRPLQYMVQPTELVPTKLDPIWEPAKSEAACCRAHDLTACVLVCNLHSLLPPTKPHCTQHRCDL